jgi:hypothetical protein
LAVRVSGVGIHLYSCWRLSKILDEPYELLVHLQVLCPYRGTSTILSEIKQKILLTLRSSAHESVKAPPGETTIEYISFYVPLVRETLMKI